MLSKTENRSGIWETRHCYTLEDLESFLAILDINSVLKYFQRNKALQVHSSISLVEDTVPLHHQNIARITNSKASHLVMTAMGLHTATDRHMTSISGCD